MLKTHAAVIIALTAATTTLGLRSFGLLQPLELRVWDAMLQMQMHDGQMRPDDRIVVVGISEEDIRDTKQWPLTDATIAKTLAKLQTYKPRVIGLNLYRNIKHEPGHQQLLSQLRRENVIGITYVGNTPEEHVPAPELLTQLLQQSDEDRIGFNDLVTDADGVVRRSLLYSDTGEHITMAFGLQLALWYLANACPQAECPVISPQLNDLGDLQLGPAVFHRLQPNSGGYHGIGAGEYQIMLRYRRTSQALRQISLRDLAQDKVDPSWLRDKIVVLGLTAPSIKDTALTPYSPKLSGSRQVPSVFIHAQLTSQILDAAQGEQLLGFWDERSEVAWILGWALGGCALVYGIRRGGPLALAALASLVGLGGMAYGLLLVQAYWVPVIAPAIAFSLAAAGMVCYRLLSSRFYDAMLQLPNRALLLKHLDWQIRKPYGETRSPITVLFLDLDRFKLVNDSLGHRGGDLFLGQSVTRIQSCLHRQDVLARVGGDEFAVLLNRDLDLAGVTDLVKRIHQRMEQPFQVQAQTVFTSISTGIARSDATYQNHPDHLLRDAHTAMYQAKALGKSRHVLFASGMRTQMARRWQIELDLHYALESQAFLLYYQPIVDLISGKLAGFEALVRWPHPEHGFISPAEFIPVAEETGMIVPLGQWILQTACEHVSQWQRQFQRPDLMISINLSGVQFTELGLVQFIAQTLERSELEGRCLKLEITETVAMQDVESAIALFLQMRELGANLSIDDFGTGYSSLSYLNRFPITTLKVDRSFVSRMDDMEEDEAIVKTIISLAHSLRMNVVAEGLETLSQLQKLQALGCEYGQGFFFAKPLTVEQVEALLQDNQPWW
jgi:diguanylate cyclase (GGDEF)-like protein